MNKNCLIVVLVMSTIVMIECRSWITNRTIPETSCKIEPKGSGQPCRQYSLEYNECDEDNLREQFPKLYTTIPGVISWPGVGTYSSLCNRTIIWGTVRDGSINYLRGFLVTFIGTDMYTRGMRQCVVVDLSNLSIDQTDALIDSKFEVDLQMPGDFDIQIKSLPPATDGHQPVKSIKASCEREREYHPQTSMSTTSLQIGSTFYIVVQFNPEVDFTHFSLSVYNYSNSQLILHRPRVSRYFEVQNLTEGNYTIMMIPEDNYQDDKEKCWCYTALDGTRECVPCHAYQSRYNLTFKERSSITSFNSERKWILQILTPVLGTVLFIGFVSGSIVRWTRRNKHGFQLRYFLTFLAGCRMCARKKTMYMVSTVENNLHTSVASAFTDMLTSLVSVDVVHGRNDCLTKYTLDVDSETLRKVDIICVVHSESSYRLYKRLQNGDLTIGDLTSKEDILFVKYMQSLKSSKLLYEKTIALHVPLSAERFVIEGKDTPTFPMVADVGDLLKNAQMKTNLKWKTISKNDHQKKIIALEGALATYKRYHAGQSIKRDDTHLDVSENMVDNIKVMRDSQTRDPSFYIESVNEAPGNAFNDDNNEKENARDFSFYAPDPSLDGISTDFSIMEGVVFDINSRYECMLQEHAELDYDCLTIGGQSV